MASSQDDISDHCILSHSIFTALGRVSFRRSTHDGAPVMVIPMGEREASVKLRSLQREFAIGDETPDGRMLARIAESLDFVAGLQPGDKLPAEVLSGEASWEPRPQHRALAAARLRLRLLSWLHPDAVANDALGDPDSVKLLDEDPKLRLQVSAAFAKAAEMLGLAESADVVRLVENLAEELAYIESLRDTLLRPTQMLARRLEHLGRDRRAGDSHRMEPMNQVMRLTSIALKQIGGRFDEVDAQTGEVLSALRNAGRQQSFIRSHRDFLYRCQRAWEPILKEWDHAGSSLDDWTWNLIGRTYQFLAPRYMPVTEWQAFNSLRQSRANQLTERAMTW